MTFIHNSISLAAVPLVATFGAKCGGLVAQIELVPAWAQPLVGPVGALIGTLIAIRWLLSRLDKQEKKMELRDIERDNNLTMIATMTAQNQRVIEQNSVVLLEVKDAIHKCAGSK